MPESTPEATICPEQGIPLCYGEREYVTSEKIDPRWLMTPVCAMQGALAAAHKFWVERLGKACLLEYFEQATDMLCDIRIQPVYIHSITKEGIVISALGNEDDCVVLHYDEETGSLDRLSFGGIANGEFHPVLKVKYEKQSVKEVTRSIGRKVTITKPEFRNIANFGNALKAFVILVPYLLSQATFLSLSLAGTWARTRNICGINWPYE
jgi:hypothetical protein